MNGRKLLTKDQLTYLAQAIESGFKKHHPHINKVNELRLETVDSAIIVNTGWHDEFPSLFNSYLDKFMARIPGRLLFKRASDLNDRSVLHDVTVANTFEIASKAATWVDEIKRNSPEQYSTLFGNKDNFGLPMDAFADVKFRLEQTRSNQLRDNHTIVDFLSPYEGVGPTAKGLMLLANYHAEKYKDHDIDIFVFANSDDFCDKLALLGHGPDLEIVVELITDPGHRMPLKFQRKNANNYVVIMDSLVDANANTFVADISKLITDTLGNKVSIISNSEQRQFTLHGCSTFTAKDAIKMALLPNLYETLEKRLIGKNKFSTPTMFYPFIQSLSQYHGRPVSSKGGEIKGYLESHPESTTENIHTHGKSVLTLAGSIEKYTKKTVFKGNEVSQNTKLQVFADKYNNKIIEKYLAHDGHARRALIEKHDGCKLNPDVIRIISERQNLKSENKISLSR